LQGQPAKQVRAKTVTASKKIRNMSNKHTETHKIIGRPAVEAHARFNLSRARVRYITLKHFGMQVNRRYALAS